MYMEAGHDNTTWQQRKLNHSIDFSRGTTWRGHDLDGRSLTNERRGPWSRFSLVSLSECLIQRQCMGTLLLPFVYVVLQIGRLWTIPTWCFFSSAHIKKLIEQPCGGKIGFTDLATQPPSMQKITHVLYIHAPGTAKSNWHPDLLNFWFREVTLIEILSGSAINLNPGLCFCSQRRAMHNLLLFPFCLYSEFLGYGSVQTGMRESLIQIQVLIGLLNLSGETSPTMEARLLPWWFVSSDGWR